MKGYLSVSGGIIHLLIELTPQPPSPGPNFYSPSPATPSRSVSCPPPKPRAVWHSPISHSHTSLFVPRWEWTFSFPHHSFTPFCLPIHPLWGFISMRVPSIPRSCQDSLEFGPCLRGRTSVPLNAVHLKQKHPRTEKRNKQLFPQRGPLWGTSSCRLSSTALESLLTRSFLSVCGNFWLSRPRLKPLALRVMWRCCLCTSEVRAETRKSVWLRSYARPCPS